MAVPTATATPNLGATGLAAELLPEIPADPRHHLRHTPQTESASRIGITLRRRTLTSMIESLDLRRHNKAHHTGGLHKAAAPDGRTLWL